MGSVTQTYIEDDYLKCPRCGGFVDVDAIHTFAPSEEAASNPVTTSPGRACLLSEQESRVMSLSASLWNAYLPLAEQDKRDGVVPDDVNDFRQAIHTIQRLIAYRPWLRQNQ